MTRRDPAALWFGSDFYEDEQVLQMDYEQQGVYHRLLWISWRNGGIASDPSTLAKMLAVPVRRFLRRIWPAIAPCWTSDGDRLVQKRQEEERARRAAAKGDDQPQEDSITADRSERMRRLARARWDAQRNAETHAHAGAARNAQRNAETHPPLASPPVQNQEKPTPTRDAQRNADAQCAPHAEGADASQSAEQQRDPVVHLQQALLATHYRSNLKGFLRSREAMKRAEDLIQTGLTPADVDRLAALDAQKAETPGALLAHWLDENLWREVLDEADGKAKERDLRERRRAAEDPLAGVYGA